MLRQMCRQFVNAVHIGTNFNLTTKTSFYIVFLEKSIDNGFMTSNMFMQFIRLFLFFFLTSLNFAHTRQVGLPTV